MIEVQTKKQFDVEWYKEHYQGELQILDGPSEKNAPFVAAGTRYSLAFKRIKESALPDDLLVETGCGDARVLFEIARQCNLSRVVGIDAAFASQRSVGPVTLMSHNLNERWPIDDGSVRYLIGMMIYEHLFDPFHSFSEIKRVLNPDGVAFVNLPLVTAVPNRLRLLCGRMPITSGPVSRWFERREWDGGHLHYFSVSSIQQLAASCGLRVIELAGVGRLHRLKTILPQLFASELTFSLQHG
jgi:SAM-dependent methyltransferase